jgi:hypothetical protein
MSRWVKPQLTKLVGQPPDGGGSPSARQADAEL